MKKKILFMIHTMNLAGTEMALLGMLKNIDYSRYAVTLLLMEYTGELIGEIPHCVDVKVMDIQKQCYFKSVKECINFRSFFISPRDVMWRFFCSIKKIICDKIGMSNDIWYDLLKNIPEIEGGYDIAIDYDGFCSRYLIKKVRASKKIIWNHFNYEFVNDDYENDKKYYEKADYLITVSTEGERVLKRYFTNMQDKILCLYNVMDIERIRRLSEEKSDDCLWEYQNNVLKLCSVGRLTEQKDFGLTIETARELKVRKVAFQWFIIGEGKERLELEKKIKEYKLEKYVYLMGSRNNPYIYMKQSDVYIQTSKYEGLCIAVGEAKVLCKPIIVVDIQGLREYIDNEINGLITERNPVQIADAVEKMDLRKRIEFSKQLGQIDWSKNDTMLKFYELIEEKDR